MKPIQIEIWSDIICPFCYIGKRHLEQAIAESGLNSERDLNITWKSFELAPGFEAEPDGSIVEILAERKGWTPKQSQQMHDEVTRKAAESGLTYDFSKTVPAPSFDAHRMLHFAADHGLQGELKERLLSAYFTEGENIADSRTLARIAEEVGFPKEEAIETAESDRYREFVQDDIEEAHALKISGAPFFLFNREYAISGAQPVSLFQKALKRVTEPASAKK